MTPMNRLLVPTFALLLAACGGGSLGESGSVLHHFSIASDGHIAVHARGAVDALVDPAGTLTIDGKVIATDAAQRELLARYNAGVLKLRNDSVAVGRAGIKTAGKAVGSVIAGLASGNPDKIGDKVDAQAREVDARVGDLCATLRDIRVTQEAIAARIAAFRPYATLTDDEVDHCN